MPRDLQPELPSLLRSLLDGEDLERKEGDTILLGTAGQDGWPRLALLSVGELYAPSGREVRLALWPDSRTTANLTANGRGTLSAILGGAAYHVELEVRREADIRRPGGHLARFTATLRSVRSDTVAYAELTGGVRYRLTDREQILARWRTTVAALRADPGGAETEPDGM